MLVNYKKFGFEINIEENEATSIVVENKYYYFKLLEAIDLASKGINIDFNFEDNFSKINKREFLTVFSPLIIKDSVNKRRQVNKYIENSFDLYDYEYEKIKSDIIKLADIICLHTDLDIYYQDDSINFPSFLKLVNFNVDISGDTYIEQLTSYLAFYKKLNNIKLVCFSNQESLLTHDDFIKLKEFLELNDITSVFLSNKQDLDYNFDSTFIIDKDLCFIH